MVAMIVPVMQKEKETKEEKMMIIVLLISIINNTIEGFCLFAWMIIIESRHMYVIANPLQIHHSHFFRELHSKHV